MSDPYEKERELETAAYDRGDIDKNELARRLREIDREELGDAQEAAREAAERVMIDRGFGP